MPQRLAGQLVDGGDPVADEPVFVADTGPADEGNWSIVATDRSAADGSWSVTVPNADAERYHAVAQFEESGTLKNALSKPFLTSQPFAQPGLVTVGFDVLPPSTIGSGISDSVVDNFNDDDDSPAGVYGPEQGLLDFYTERGSGSFSRESGGAIVGNTALSVISGSSDDILFSGDGDGLNRYPQKGEVFSCFVRDGTENRVFAGYFYGAEFTNDDLSGYYVRIDTSNDEIQLLRKDGGSFSSLGSASVSLVGGEFYDLEVAWHDGTGSESDNTHIVSIYEVASGDRGTELGSLTATDSTYSDNVGIGFRDGSGGTADPMADDYRVIGDVE